MNEQIPDSIKRAALLKQIGISGFAAITGVATVEEVADAQQVFNIWIETNPRHGCSRHPDPSPSPPPVSRPKAGVTPVQTIQIVGELSEISFCEPSWHYKIYGMKTAYIEGTDENGRQHGTGELAPEPKKLQYGFYVVVGSPEPLE